MSYGMPVKYGRQGHAPRCACPDCYSSYLEHNRNKHCDCMDCVYHREINAPAPPTVYPESNWNGPSARTPQEPFPNATRYVETGTTGTWKEPRNVPLRRKDRRSMADLKMCERKGCNSIVRGEAIGLLDVMTDTRPQTPRKGYELCPACVADVMGVLDMEPAPGTREKAYERPYEPPAPEGDDVEAATDEQLLATLLQRLFKRGQQSLEAGNGSGEG